MSRPALRVANASTRRPRFNVVLLGTHDDQASEQMVSIAMDQLRQRVPISRFVYLLGDSAASALTVVLAELADMSSGVREPTRMVHRLVQQVDLAVLLTDEDRLGRDLRTICEANSIELLTWSTSAVGATRTPQQAGRMLARACSHVYSERMNRPHRLSPVTEVHDADDLPDIAFSALMPHLRRSHDVASERLERDT
ncbi:MAG: hypothetical protein U0163_15170 [Gemmatimonadaceae bacterium]